MSWPEWFAYLFERVVAFLTMVLFMIARLWPAALLVLLWKIWKALAEILGELKKRTDPPPLKRETR